MLQLRRAFSFGGIRVDVMRKADRCEVFSTVDAGGANLKLDQRHFLW